VQARFAPVVAVAIWGVGVSRERRCRAAGHARLVGELAEAVPLLELAAAGGLTVREAVTAAAPWLDGSLGRALSEAVSSSRAGPLADELDRLADRVGPAARPLASALAAADRYGAPLQAPLAQLAIETRLSARRLAEEQARQVPVRLLFPLVAGVLPAFVLLTVVPLLVSSLRAVQVTTP
jgi:tight adherence protein C